jgi:hypothetical protein
MQDPVLVLLSMDKKSNTGVKIPTPCTTDHHSYISRYLPNIPVLIFLVSSFFYFYPFSSYQSPFFIRHFIMLTFPLQSTPISHFPHMRTHHRCEMTRRHKVNNNPFHHPSSNALRATTRRSKPTRIPRASTNIANKPNSRMNRSVEQQIPFSSLSYLHDAFSSPHIPANLALHRAV